MAHLSISPAPAALPLVRKSSQRAVLQRALLTPEIQAELRNYSPHELLTKGFTIIARPRPRTGQGTTTA